ncbi:ABC transporter permease [Oryzibacter oryziterrae]|uniref:ABC transporter permease n=1 Tax=Oryzibacter oryziterrae TaxID=2766474 RepID=UPI001F03156D|nr:ABC transporter permease subunit [Oryzibacter oryziterrae]
MHEAASPLSRTPAVSARSRVLPLLLVATPVLLALWLVIWPAAEAVILTFLVPGEGGTEVWSTANYARFFGDSYSVNNFTNTLWTTAVTTTILLVIGLPLAIYLRFAKGQLPATVQSLVMFPMFVPSIIVAYAFIRTLGPNGTVDIFLHAVGLPRMRTPYLTPWGPVIGLVWDGLPLTVLLLLSGLGNVTRPAVDAARDVGAGWLAILVYIILPRMRSSLLVTLSFNVLGIFSSFTLPYLLGPAAPEMMGPFMQRTFGDLQDVGMARTQAVITFAVCLLFGALYVWSIAKGRTKSAAGGKS